MKSLVLDSEAFSQIARERRGGAAPFLAMLVAAVAEDVEIVVPAAVLAEQYRGGTHDQAVDACLARTQITVADTTRELAHHVGHILARAGRGSADHVDACVVAVAVTSPRATIATGDPDDLNLLATDHPQVVIAPI